MLIADADPEEPAFRFRALWPGSFRSEGSRPRAVVFGVLGMVSRDKCI